MVKKCLLTGLVAGFLSISSTLYAGESEIILKDNTTASGLTVKEETANTTIARFRGDGNVGIGTTSPNNKLTVAGGNVSVLNNGGDPFIEVGDIAGTTLLAKWNSAGDYGFLQTQIGDTWGGNLVLQPNSGNVGIGTTTPGAKLTSVLNSGDWTTPAIKAVNNFYSGSGSYPLQVMVPTLPSLYATGLLVGKDANSINSSAVLGFVYNSYSSRSTAHVFVGGDSFGTGLTVAKGGYNGINTAYPACSLQVNGARDAGNASTTDDVCVLDNGNVGIGTTAPSEKLEVSGNIKASGTVSQGSSRELKKNISYISTKEAMKALNGLKPVRFEYKADNFGEEHLGFIAEDVPELVAEQDRKHLNPMDLTAVFAKVIQEQQKMLQTQNEAMDVMKHEIEMLKSAMNYDVKGL